MELLLCSLGFSAFGFVYGVVTMHRATMTTGLTTLGASLIGGAFLIAAMTQ